MSTFLRVPVVLISVTLLLSPSFAFAAYTPYYLLSDVEMTDTLAMNRNEIQTFLERGSLASYKDTNIFGQTSSAADIIYDVAWTFGLSPQFLLVLLQREQSLIEDPSPSQNQLDWAMGYGVCDDCSKDDPGIQKFRGFANQVYYAAKRIRESYLTDLALQGTTLSGVGPGLPATIDGIEIIPTNAATSVLYTYTPHLHGNENFVKIWQRWFTRDYPSGSLLQDTTTGGIWLIQYGKRRPITSRTAFLTRFQETNVIPVKPSALEAYEIGAPISFPNYSLLRSPHGTIYLVVDDRVRGFRSREAFRALGFTDDEVIDVTFEDLAAYEEGDPITEDSSAPEGRLTQDTSTGGIYYIENNVRHPLMSREILNNRFGGKTIYPADPTELASQPVGEPVGFQDGTLVAVVGSPDVFVISDGLRRPIVNGETFESYGWQWDHIIWTNERSVLLHPLGEYVVLQEATPDEEAVINEASQP